MEPLFASVYMNGRTIRVKRETLSDDEKKRLDSNPFGILYPLSPPSTPSAPISPISASSPSVTVASPPSISLDPLSSADPSDFSTPTPPKRKNPESFQDKMDMKLGRLMREWKFPSVKSDSSTNWNSRGHELIKNLFHQMTSLKEHLGGCENRTPLANPAQFCADALGMHVSTVFRILGRDESQVLNNQPSQDDKTLALLSDEQKSQLISEIEHHYETDTNFTIKSFLKTVQNKYNFPYGATTLRKILRSLNFRYKVKTYNPFATERPDINRLRKIYLEKIEYHRSNNDFIVYFDETWIFHGMSRKNGWLRKNTNAYELARMGNINEAVPGFPATSNKGIRAVILAVLTESQILPGSIDVITSHRPESEQLVDYHKTMTAESYGQYTDKVFPLILAACPPGRRPVFVIDNASIHNKLVMKVVKILSNKVNRLFRLRVNPGKRRKS